MPAVGARRLFREALGLPALGPPLKALLLKLSLASTLLLCRGRGRRSRGGAAQGQSGWEREPASCFSLGRHRGPPKPTQSSVRARGHLEQHLLCFCPQPHPLQCPGHHLQQVGPPGLHAALQHRSDPVPGSHGPLQPLLPHEAAAALLLHAQYHLVGGPSALGRYRGRWKGSICPNSVLKWHLFILHVRNIHE